MHSIAQRANAVSALATSTLMALLAAIAILSFLTPKPVSDASIAIPTLQVVWGRDERDWYERKAQDYTSLRFDLRADLTPLFGMNTKQLFIYLTADYDTTSMSTYGNHEVVVWDRIVRRKKDAKVNVSGVKNKYVFKEITGSFKDVKANFTLHYNLMPWVGLLEWGTVGVTSNATIFPPAIKRSQH